MAPRHQRRRHTGNLPEGQERRDGQRDLGETPIVTAQRGMKDLRGMNLGPPRASCTGQAVLGAVHKLQGQ